ncbi:MAG TPA: hypothetical protein VN641_08275 [Urbifossiella sp.]|nr:hypothetical protein [Urbifossiella sp.]
MATNAEWSQGFARQARADFDTFLKLQRGSVSAEDIIHECHKLQFLQMACEKLVKSHLCGEGASVAAIQSSHAYISGTLPIVLMQAAHAVNFSGKHAQWVLRHARHIAREIEILAPAVKRGGNRPDNCEYPWESSGVLHRPFGLVVRSDLLAGRTIGPHLPQIASVRSG